MTEFLQSITLFPLILSLGTYQIGVWCQKKTKLAICNPLLIATLLSIGFLLLVGFDLQVYQASLLLLELLCLLFLLIYLKHSQLYLVLQEI